MSDTILQKSVQIQLTRSFDLKKKDIYNTKNKLCLSPEVPVHPLAQHCILKRKDKQHIQADSPESCRIHPETNCAASQAAV